MKEADPRLQAKLWLTLAKSSGLPVDQLSAYQTAVTILDGMFTQAFARLELGEWMYANRFPARVSHSKQVFRVNPHDLCRLICCMVTV